MAINRGVLGSQTGSMGGITASNWKGKNVYKQKVPATNSSNTPPQAMQRSKFAYIQQFARSLGPAIRIGFREAAAKMTEQNVFTSRNIYAVMPDGEGWVLDETLLSISAGTVAPLKNFAFAYNEVTRLVTLTWVDDSNGVDGLPTDKVYIAAADRDGVFAGNVLGTVLRSAQQATFTLPLEIAQKHTGTYTFGFAKRANSTATSPSTVVIVENPV